METPAEYTARVTGTTVRDVAANTTKYSGGSSGLAAYKAATSSTSKTETPAEYNARVESAKADAIAEATKIAASTGKPATVTSATGTKYTVLPTNEQIAAAKAKVTITPTTQVSTTKKITTTPLTAEQVRTQLTAQGISPELIEQAANAVNLSNATRTALSSTKSTSLSASQSTASRPTQTVDTTNKVTSMPTESQLVSLLTSYSPASKLTPTQISNVVKNAGTGVSTSTTLQAKAAQDVPTSATVKSVTAKPQTNYAGLSAFAGVKKQSVSDFLASNLESLGTSLKESDTTLSGFSITAFEKSQEIAEDIRNTGTAMVASKAKSESKIRETLGNYDSSLLEYYDKINEAGKKVTSYSPSPGVENVAESAARLVEFGGTLPASTEIAGKNPELIPVAAVTALTLVPSSMYTSATTEPKQFISDIGVQAVLGAGASKVVPKVKVGELNVVETVGGGHSTAFEPVTYGKVLTISDKPIVSYGKGTGLSIGSAPASAELVAGKTITAFSPKEISAFKSTVKNISGKGEVNYFTAAEDVARQVYKQKEAIYSPETFEITSKHIPDTAKTIVKEEIKAYTEDINVYGSAVQKQQMGEYLTRVPKDIEINVENPSQFVKNLETKFKAENIEYKLKGEGTDSPKVYFKFGETWQKGIEIFEIKPDKTIMSEYTGSYVPESEMQYNFKYLEPTEIEGISVMKLQEQAPRKLRGGFVYKEGGINPEHMGRVKDIADLIELGTGYKIEKGVGSTKSLVTMSETAMEKFPNEIQSPIVKFIAEKKRVPTATEVTEMGGLSVQEMLFTSKGKNVQTINNPFNDKALALKAANEATRLTGTAATTENIKTKDRLSINFAEAESKASARTMKEFTSAFENFAYPERIVSKKVSGDLTYGIEYPTKTTTKPKTTSQFVYPDKVFSSGSKESGYAVITSKPINEKGITYPKTSTSKSTAEKNKKEFGAIGTPEKKKGPGIIGYAPEIKTKEKDIIYPVIPTTNKKEPHVFDTYPVTDGVINDEYPPTASEKKPPFIIFGDTEKTYPSKKKEEDKTFKFKGEDKDNRKTKQKQRKKEFDWFISNEVVGFGKSIRISKANDKYNKNSITFGWLK